MPRFRDRLSTRLLIITAMAVMLAEILIFVPSVADFRNDWLAAKLETAAAAGLALQGADAAGNASLSGEPERNVLKALDARLIALGTAGSTQLLARDESLESVDRHFDLSGTHPFALVRDAFDTLIFGGDRTIRITGPVGDGSMTGEVVMREAPLRSAMLIYARNIFLISLVIALFAAGLVYAAISHYLIKPIRDMTRSMVVFAEKPSDAGRIIRPTHNRDEIAIAERELATMQSRLAETLREQRHLADLGLAVSKVNHDLRNILASAQLISDGLSSVQDARVQRMLPMLLRSLDRALNYTRSVLDYGKAVETTPRKRRVMLRELVSDVFGILALSKEAHVELVNDVDPDTEIAADPDQFHRVLLNLCRNAIQALAESDDHIDSVVERVRVEVGAGPSSLTRIMVEDTGPGLPARARENLFAAFRGSGRTGGTGLGLAIVAEIVEAHGGSIHLQEAYSPGTRFLIDLPAIGGEILAQDLPAESADEGSDNRNETIVHRRRRGSAGR